MLTWMTAWITVWMVLTLSFITLAAGLIWLYFAWRTITRDKRRAYDSKHWPVAGGHIRTSHVVAIQHGPSLVNEPLIEYSYVVRGQTYSSKRISFDPAAIKLPYEVVARYPVGARVNVTYDPIDPTVSVLQPGRPGPGFFVYVMRLAGPIILIVAGIVMLLIFT